MMISIAAFALAMGAADPAGLDAEFRDGLSGLEGRWAGVLVYRDYRTDERVTLPHRRTVRLAPDGGYMHTALEYTDPGVTVYGAELVTVSNGRVQSAYAGGGEISVSDVRIEAFEPHAQGWSAILVGPTQDGGVEAEARYTYMLDGDALNIEKAVRVDPNGPYRFRNSVDLTRQ